MRVGGFSIGASAVLPALVVCGSALAASGDECVAAKLAPAVADRALDGNAIALADGRVVRLAGVVAPRGGTFAEEARQRLQALTGGKPVLLGDQRPTPDRYGRIVARVFLGEDRNWVEGVLLRAGLLQVFTLRDDRACARALLAAEAAAREAKAGLWADPQFAIRRADDSSLSRAGGLYQIVEGEVLSTGRTAVAAYLNFGWNWSTDFTVTVNMADAELFESEGLDLDALAGRRIRVRGWLSVKDGAAMRVDHPEQIELLGK
jgi:endonuclease YncB( thermonuclease family)